LRKLLGDGANFLFGQPEVRRSNDALDLLR
jgi:hypothetical protein